MIALNDRFDLQRTIRKFCLPKFRLLKVHLRKSVLDGKFQRVDRRLLPGQSRFPAGLRQFLLKMNLDVQIL